MLCLFDWLHVSVYLFVGGNHVIVGGLGLVDLLLFLCMYLCVVFQCVS